MVYVLLVFLCIVTTILAVIVTIYYIQQPDGYVIFLVQN